MVAIVGGRNGDIGGNVGGNSALGLENSALRLGGAGIRGNAATGQSGDTIFVNAATGNLVLQRQDELLTDIGTDTTLLRTYNSLGRRNDDNADNWQMSVVRTVGSLTGAINTADSRITRTDGDGSSRVFVFDTQRSLYLNRDGQDAFDTLAYATGAWTFTDGASQRTETFDWNGTTGRITASADADGNATRYGYTGSLLTLVTDAAGERIRLNYNGTLLTDVRTERSNGTALTRVRYAYDASQRLSTVTVDLSPDDQSVADSRTYVTRYTYVGTSTALQSVTQSDGTSITFNSYDSSGRLTSFTQAVNGINRVTTLGYGNGETRVTDALGTVTTYKTDPAGRLSGIVAPGQALSYEYDSDGRLIGQVDGNGNRTVYGYDANGNQVLQRDAAGNTVTRSFGSRNELLTESRYATPDTDGAGAALPTLPQTTRYAYDGKNRLRFVVTAEGRVTEYRYSAQGLLTSRLNYAGNRYPTASLASTAALPESALAAWTAGTDKTKLIRTDHVYDARGNLSRSVSFSKTLASGEGVVDGTESVSQFTYDQAGLLLSTVSAVGSATLANTTDGITRYGYDGLGRQVTSTDALGNTTLQQYDLQGNTLTTRQANGLVTTSVRNAAGELVSVMQADGAASLGKTTYAYDAAGRLRTRVDPTGVRTSWLYDAAGHKSAEIDGNGSLTEWMYNNNDQVVRTIRYTTALTAGQLTSLTDAAGNPSPVTLGSVRPASAGSRSTWNLYDDANRLAKSIDELGFVTLYQYDGTSRLVATVQYSKPVNAALIIATTKVSDAAVSPLADALNDRKTSWIFDNDGNQVGSVDADGYLTQTDFDAAGRIVHTVRHAKPDMAYHGMSAAAMATKATTESNNTANSHAWTFYDGQGRESANVDGEGFAKEVRYDLAGNRRTELQYLQVQAGLVDKLVAGTQSGQPAFTGLSLTTINDYDTLNRLIRSTNAEGTVTQHTYDSAGNLTRTDRAWNATDLRTTATRYDKLGRITAELTGEGSAALAALPATATTAQIDAVWSKYATTFTYDAAGRQTGSTDPLGNRTLRYYDADGQLSHVINAAGEVTAYAYDALGQMTQSVRYAAAIGSNVLASLSGGLVNAMVTSAVAGIAGTNDATVTTTYTLRGQIDTKIDEEAYLSRSTYNAFGEQDSSTRQIDATRQVKSTFAYNRRGLVIATVEDAGVATRTTTVEYDAFGCMVRRTEPGSRVQQWTYDRSGRVIQTMDPYRASDSFTYDALGRELTHTDSLGNTSRTSYDDINRSMTVISAEGVAVTSTRNRHGELVQVRDAQNRTTSYQYNRDGLLTKTSHDNVPLTNAAGTTSTGTVLLAAYDTAGRLIESTDGNGVATRLTYDAANRLLTKVIDPNGLKRTTSTSYDGRNRAITVTDANGVATRTTYGKKGDIVTVAVDPAGLNLQTSYVHDGLGNTVTVTEGAGGVQPKITTYAYDNLGRRISEATAGTGGRTYYTYDAANRLETKTDALGNVTRLFYDPVKPVTYVIDPEGGVTRTTQDAEGRTAETRRYANKVADTFRPDFSKAAPVPESADDQVTTNLYDRDGRLTFVVDGTRGVTERKYDGNGNVTGTVAYANRLAAGVTLATDAVKTATRTAGFADALRDERTHAIYDGLNRLTLQINGAGGITTWAYDGNGNVLEQRAYANAAAIDINRLGDSAYVPSMPVADASRDRQQAMAYDTAGRLVASAIALKASGSLIEWAVTLHDYKTPSVVIHTQLATALVSSRPTPAQMLGAARTATRDLTTLELKDAAGRIAYTINTNRIVTGHTYDKLGRVVFSRTYGQPLPGTVSLVSLTSASLPAHLVANAADRSSHTVYDAASRPVYAIDSQGAVTETVFDGMGNAVATIAYATPINAAGVNDRSLASDVKALLSSNAALDRIERRVYDGNGRAVYRTNARGYVTQSDYDASGRLIGTTEHATAVAAAATITTRSQIAAALSAQTASQKAGSRSNGFRYDQAGRLKDSTDGMGRTETFTYDGIGRKTGFTDKNGAYWDYVYDADGRLVKETSAQVEVLRFKTDVNGAIVLDAAGNPVADATGLRHIITLTGYDNFGNVISRTEAAGLPEQRTTRWVYSADGRQVSTIHPTVAVYADEGSAVLANGAAGNAARKEAIVTPTSTVIYDALGNAVVNRDIGGKYRYRVIDGAGQLRYEVDAMGYVTGHERNSFGEVTALTRYAKEINTSARGATAYTVADIDKLIAANDHSADRTIRTTYDNLGRIIKVSEPLVEAYDPTVALGSASFTAAHTTDKLYNAFGEVIRQSVYGADATGRAVTVAADTGYAYNTLGQQVAIVTMAERAPGASGATGAKGYLTVLQYDSRGNLAEQVEYAALHDYADSAWNSASGVLYTLDPVSTADRLTRFAYDASNRKVAETKVNIEFATRPDNSSNPSTTTLRGDATTRYAYDGIGNITSVTDAAGTVTYHYYDVLGRVVATSTPSVQRLRAQVAQVYAAILNRSPDKAGLDYFVNRMLAGTTLEQVTEDINASDEAQAWRNSSGMAWFRTMAATDTSRAIVTLLYRQLLSREPDAAGIDGWIKLMNGQADGKPRTTGQITGAMMRAVASEMNIDAAVVNDKTRAALAFVDANGSDTTVARQDAALAAASAQRRILVAQLHAAVLGRVPDASTLNNWASSTLDAGKLAQLFISSDEGRALYPSRMDANEVLQRLFGHIHDRAPSSEEVAALKADRTQLTLEDYAGCVNAMLQNLNAPAVPASSTATITARIGFSRKVASVLNSIDVISGPMPMSEFKYDALGNMVQRVDYANASEVATAAGTWGPGASATDRMSYTSYDAQGRALQRIDTQRTLTSTPKSVANTSFDVFGNVAKQWRTVTNIDGRQATAFTVNRHDANGRKIETVMPGTPAEGATQATTTVSSRTEYNAFGEVIVRKTDEVATEFNEYDNAGRLWRSNAGDGVTRIAQFDAQGRQTVELRSAVVNLKTEVNSASQAAASAGMIRSETRYDLMGRVVAQIKPEQLAGDIDSNTGAPTVATVSLQLKVNGTASPEVLEQPNGGDTRKQVLYWTGKNNVNLQWTSLAGLGSGDVKVQFDYLSRPVTVNASPAGTDYAQTSNPTPLPPSGEDYPQFPNTSTLPTTVGTTTVPAQAGSLTRTFGADEAATGVILEWGDANTPGFDRMTGVTVWKKDVNGNWTQVLKSAREGVLGSQVRFTAPPDLTTAYELFYRPAGASADIKVGGERLWHLGDQLVFDTTGLAEGHYSYTLRTLKEGSNVVSTLNGGITITAPERRAQVARLFAVLLNRAPDANGLQSHLKALEAGTTIAQLAQNLFNTAEARNLYPATLSAAQFVQNLLSITLGTPLAQSQAIATTAAARLGANPANWGAGIIALLDEVAASRDPALTTARALLANKTAVASAFAGDYGGYRYNDARDVLRLVTASDTTAALALAKQALWRRQLTQLYVGLLHRAPDAAGLQAWLDAMVKGTGIDAIGRGLLDSAEGKLAFPPALSNAQFVTRIYDKVFGRTPDAEGQAFWTAALNQNPDRSKLAQDMMRAVAEYLGDNSVILDAQQLLNNRISIGLAFADSGSNDVMAASVINSAVTAANNVSAAAEQMTSGVGAHAAAVQDNASVVELAAMATPAERTLAQLSALYVVLLNRAPDRAGLLAQAAALPPQLPLASALANTAQALYASPEAQTAGLYLNLTDAAFVSQVYKFAFNRIPTANDTSRWTQVLAGNATLRGSVALSIINDALTYDGPDAVLVDSRNLLNARVAAGMTYALNLGGEDATLARTMLAKVTATNIVDALKLASDALSAQAAARALAAAAATTAALPRTNADVAAANAQAKAVLAIDAARALATSTTPEAEQAQAIVRVWFAVTGKVPDLAAFTKAFSQLRNGTSLSALTQSLLATTEGLARYPATLDNTQFVTKVYAHVVNRAPDADGLAYWKRALDAGASRSQVLFDITYAFLNLSEASAADLKQRTAVLQQLQTTLANLGSVARSLPALHDYSASTLLASRATPAERSYTQISQLYVALLGRAPERGGLLYQAAALQAGDPAAWNARFAQIASNILNSGEAQGNGYANLADGQFVGKFYMSALGRSPIAAESAKWMAMLGGDTGKRGQVIIAMLDDMLFATPSDSTSLSVQNLFNNRIAAGLTFALNFGGSDVALARAVNTRVTASDTTAAISHAVTTLVNALTAPSAAVHPNADTALTRINAELAAAETLAQASSAFDSAATGATPAATASGADTAVQITRLYRAVFNRAPDNAGFNWWFQNIRNGQTIESVAQVFIGSGDAVTIYPPSSSNTDFVSRVYANLLGRSPDAEGLAYWTNNLNRGVTRGKVFLDVLNAFLGNTRATLPDLQRRATFNQNVATALATSVSLNTGTSQYSAYVAACDKATADVNAGVALLDSARKLDAASTAANAAAATTASSSSVNLTAQITLLYQAALNRVPDIPGLLNNLQSGLGIASIATNVVASAEAQSFYPASLSAADFVTRVYQNVIGRTPDAGGLAYWTAEINGGKPRGAVLWSIVSSALANTTSTFTTKVATSDLQLRSTLIRRWATALTGLRNTASAGSNAATALANLVTSNTSSTNSLISQANALAPAGATGTLPQRQTQIVRLYALLLNRAPTVDELNTATSLLQSGKTVVDIAAGLLSNAALTALTVPQLINRIAQQALGNVPDAALRARWSSQFAGQTLAQTAASLSAEIVAYQGNDLSALTVQNTFQGKNGQYLANLAMQAGAITGTAVAERTALLNGLSTAGTRAQAETTAASAQLVARTATDTASATITTTGSLQATKLAQAYQAILGRMPDVMGFGNYLAQLQGKPNLPAEYQRIAQELLDSAEGRTLYSPTLSNSQFVTQAYTRIIGRAPDATGLEFWTKALSTMPRGRVLLDILDSFLTNPKATVIDLQSRSAFLGKTAATLQALTTSASAISTAATALPHLVANFTGATLAANRATDASAKAAMTTASALRAQLTGLYVMLMNRSPDYDGLTHWSKAITAGTHKPADVAQALLESDAGRAAYPAAMSNAEFVSKLYQQVLGRTPDAASLAHWSARIQVTGRAQTTVELAIAMTDYASFDVFALTSQWLFNNKVTQSLAGLHTAARQAVVAATQQSAIAAQLATVNLPTSTKPAASAVKVNSPTTDNRRPQVTLQVDRWGNVVSMTDPRSVSWVTRYTYNAGNNVTSITRADGQSLFYTYDQLGRQLSSTDARGNTNGTRYDALGRVVQQLQADGGIVTSQYDAFGQRIRMRQANGVLTDYAYDHLGRVNRVSQAAVMGVDVYRSQTDSPGAVPRLVLQSHQALTETSRYDELGRRIQVTTADGAITKLHYDLRGNLTRQVDALDKTTRSTYDRFDNKIVQERPDGKKLRWTYLADGNVATRTDLSGTQIQYRYNQLRQVTHQSTVTVSAGHAAQNLVFAYDNSSGLLTKIVDQLSGQTTRYAYDLAGNRTREKTSIESGGRQTKVLQDNHISYDRLGRMTRVADSRYVAAFEYDANGNRTHQTVAYIDDNNVSRNVDLWNDYDRMNRQTIVDGKRINGAVGIDASGGQQIAYDNAGNRIAVRQWGRQLVTQASDNDSGTSGTAWSTVAGMVQETYRYDAAGRLSKTLRDGLETDTRKYDAAGRTMGTGASTLQTKAGIGTLSDALAQAGVQADVYTNTYNAGGQLIHQGVKDIGGIDKSGMQMDRYDDAGNLLQYTLWQAQVGKQVSTYSYTYDHFDTSVVSNIKVVRDDKAAATVNAFDGRGQMTSVTSTDVDRKVTLRSLSNNAEGQVLEKVEEGRKTRSLLVNGELLGSSAAQADGKVTDTFAANYEPVSAASLSAAPTSYRVQQGQTLQSIAKAVWGDANLWYLIADANGISTVKEGDLITIPTRINTVHNDYQTYKPYDASSVIGDITPTLPMPAAEQGCGAMGQVLMVAVAIIVTAYTAGTMSGNAGSLFEVMQAGTAFMSGTATAATEAITTALGSIGTSAIAGATGSVASQFVGNVIGAQDDFSLKNIGLAAIGAGVANGVSGLPSTTNAMVRAAAGNVVGQGMGMLTGLREEFHWKDVVASVLGAGVGRSVGNGMDDLFATTNMDPLAQRIGSGVVSGLAAGIASSVYQNGKLTGTQGIVDAFSGAFNARLSPSSTSRSQQESVLHKLQRDDHSTNIGMALHAYGSQDSMASATESFTSYWDRHPMVYASNEYADRAEAFTHTDAGTLNHASMVNKAGLSSTPILEDGSVLATMPTIVVTASRLTNSDDEPATGNLFDRVVEFFTGPDYGNLSDTALASLPFNNFAANREKVQRAAAQGKLPYTMGGVVGEVGILSGQGVLGAGFGRLAASVALRSGAGSAYSYFTGVLAGDAAVQGSSIALGRQVGYSSEQALASLALGGVLNTGATRAVAADGIAFGKSAIAEAAENGVRLGPLKIYEPVRMYAFSPGNGGNATALFSRLVDGGGLATHEAAGGHLILKHVGQSEWALAARLAAEPRIPAASTFITRAEAEAAVSAVLDARATELSTWVSKGARGQLPLNAPFNGGLVLQRGISSPTSGTGSTVVLRGTGGGNWRVVTGYPTP